MNPPLAPAGVVTIIAAVPAVPGGADSVHPVDDKIVKELAALPSNVTAVAPLRFVPVRVTVFPPDAGPDDGVSAVTVGAGAAV